MATKKNAPKPTKPKKPKPIKPDVGTLDEGPGGNHPPPPPGKP